MNNFQVEAQLPKNNNFQENQKTCINSSWIILNFSNVSPFSIQHNDYILSYAPFYCNKPFHDKRKNLLNKYRAKWF